MHGQLIPSSAVDRRRHGAGTPQQRPVTILLSCTVGGRSHHVTDQEFAAGRRHGYYRALCGHTVAIAAMISPDGPPCKQCPQYPSDLDVSRQPDRARLADRAARHRRPGALRRLVVRQRVSGTANGLVRRISA